MLGDCAGSRASDRYSGLYFDLFMNIFKFAYIVYLELTLNLPVENGM